MDISKFTATELSQKIKAGEITVRQAVDAVFNSIDSYDPTYHCYNTVCREEAYKRADEVQKMIDNGELNDSPLAGVPVSVKDNICTKGIRTTCSSKMLGNFIPTYDATVVKRMNDAGMIIIGKLNMDEFAMGSTTETSAWGNTKNPWDISKVPGGSSGGSAAAVASGEAVIALGSDTGGSIRQPSAFCGITGFKPTYGSVSRYGLVAFASSLDQIGPMTKDVVDCAALYQIISGRDENDGTTMDFEKFDYKEVLDCDISKLKIGVPNEYFGFDIEEGVKERVIEVIEKFKEMGAQVEFFDLPLVKYGIPTYYVIACAEASSNLSRYDGIKYGYSSENADDLLSTFVKSRSEGFGMEVKRRVLLGNFVLSSGYYDAYYKKALQSKRLINQAFSEAFQKYDLILGPVTPTTALEFGEITSDKMKIRLNDIFAVMANIAGIPSISIPCGFDSENLPVGLQIMGKAFDDKLVMQAANAYQQVTDFHKFKPILTGGADR